MATVKVTQVRSAIGKPKDQKRTLLALGLRKMHQTVTHETSSSIDGMIRAVHHLVKVEHI